MDNGVVTCRFGHLWTVHEEGRCHPEDGSCTCTGFYPAYWRPNVTRTCRRCGHERSEHGVTCGATVGQETVTERHFGFEGDTWTTEEKISVRCACEAFC